MNSLLSKGLSAVLLAVAPWATCAQTRETVNVVSSGEAIRVMASSPDFRISTRMVRVGADENACALGVFSALRAAPVVSSGRLVDGTTVAARMLRSRLLVVCLGSGTAVQAHMVVASVSAAETAQLLGLADGFAPARRPPEGSGEKSFARSAPGDQPGQTSSMVVTVGFKARRAMPVEDCILEAEQAMSQVRLSEVTRERNLVWGRSSDGIAVAVCVPVGERTDFRLAAFADSAAAANRLRDQVTARIPGRPGSKPEVRLDLGKDVLDKDVPSNHLRSAPGNGTAADKPMIVPGAGVEMKRRPLP